MEVKRRAGKHGLSQPTSQPASGSFDGLINLIHEVAQSSMQFITPQPAACDLPAPLFCAVDAPENREFSGLMLRCEERQMKRLTAGK